MPQITKVTLPLKSVDYMSKKKWKRAPDYPIAFRLSRTRWQYHFLEFFIRACGEFLKFAATWLLGQFFFLPKALSCFSCGKLMEIFLLQKGGCLCNIRRTKATFMLAQFSLISLSPTLARCLWPASNCTFYSGKVVFPLTHAREITEKIPIKARSDVDIVVALQALF